MNTVLILRCATFAATTLVLLSAVTLNSQDNSNPHFLITNNDFSQGSSATLYRIMANGSIHQAKLIKTGGTGVNGVGAVATKRVSTYNLYDQKCAFVSDAGTADVAGISVSNLTLTGTFKAASGDTAPSGMGVVNNGTYLYASLTGSNTIATYAILPGCILQYLQDIPAAGLSGGSPVDMKAHRNILVVSFQDGSIGSFNLANGVPVANGDLQLSTGNTQHGSFPAGVDITSDGHFAIFGATNVPPLVEVSDISSGKLSPTVVYSNIGSGGGSEAIWLSPDETLLYLSNFSSMQVTAAFFDTSTGGVTFGCTGTFKGTGFQSGLATAREQGTGLTVYVMEADQGIGFASVTENSGACSIQEDTGSPLSKTVFNGSAESIATFPPRPF